MTTSTEKEKSSSDYKTDVSSVSPSSAIGSKSRRRKLEVNQDGGWGWMVVLGSCVCQFFLIGINRSMGIVYILLQEKFSATEKETALAASIFVSFRALGGPLASKLCDRFGCRAVTVTGGVLLCLGLVMSAFAVNLINVYITFGLIAGFGGVLVFSPSYIAVSEWFDKKKGKAMSFSTLGTGFGSIVMAPTVSALVAYYGYFGTMLITGALMLHSSVGGALYRKPSENCSTSGENEEIVVADEGFQSETASDADKETQINDDGREFSSKKGQSPNLGEDAAKLCVGNRDGESNKTSDNSFSNDETHDEAKPGVTRLENSSTRDLSQIPESNEVDLASSRELKSKNRRLRLRSCVQSSICCNIPFVIYCLMVTATQGCIQSVLIFLPGRGKELGASREQAALLLTIFGVSDMVGRFVFGFIFDVKFLRSRRTHLYTGIAASFAIFAILLGFMPSYISLASVTVLVAFFEGGAHSQRATNVTDLVKPSQMSLGVGLVIFSQGVGNFYGPLVGGALKDHTRSFASCFIFGGATLLVACTLTTLHSMVLHRNNVKRKKLQNREMDKM